MRPSGAGPNLPTLDGVLHYAISGSEIVQFGYYGGGDVTASTAVSGDVAYTGKSADLPFSLLFAGGIILPNQSGQGTNYYSSAAVSQGLVTRNWTFNISDSVSFPAAVADDRPIGNCRCRRSWIGAHPGTNGRSGRRDFVRCRQPGG